MPLPLTLILLTVAAPCRADNLLPNPGFEKSAVDGRLPAGWTQRRGEGLVEYRDDGGHTGARYVHMVDASPTAGVLLESDRVPARGGGTYRAAVWFRTEDKCRPGVYLQFFNDLGQRVHSLFQRADGPTVGWARVQVEAIAPRDCAEANVALYGYIGDVGSFDADDVEMTVEGGLEPGQGLIPKATPGGKTMADIGSRLELFVDDYLVDSLTGSAERRLHAPQPQEIALTFDKPWEGPYAGYVGVFQDEAKVRLIYRGWSDLHKAECTCMAESEDGIHFTRPNVGVFEFSGSRDNNIIWQGAGSHNFAAFRDLNPAAPPEQRYKALGSAGPKASLVAFVSPDCLHWSKLREEPVITEGAFDSQNLAFWDPLREEYVEYHRGFKDGFRDIMTCHSKDFLTWSRPVWLDYGDAPKEHLYTNAIIPYFRAPHIYLGFPCRFVEGRKKIASHPDPGMNDGVLMSSRDGLHFQRWLEAFVRPGLDPLRWTDRSNYPAWGMVATSPEEISIYWTEHYRYPDNRLRRGTIRTDGFVSVHAGAAGGEVLTRPLVFSGKRLLVNYSTSAVGSLRFELTDEAGQPLPGFSMGDSEVLFGDEIAHEVSWRDGGDLSLLAGKPVRLRVRLKDADLYSLQFAA